MDRKLVCNFSATTYSDVTRLSSAKDAVIRVWDRKTLNLHRTLRGHEGPVNAVGLQTGRIVRVDIYACHHIMTNSRSLGQCQRGRQDDPLGY